MSRPLRSHRAAIQLYTVEISQMHLAPLRQFIEIAAHLLGNAPEQEPAGQAPGLETASTCRRWADSRPPPVCIYPWGGYDLGGTAKPNRLISLSASRSCKLVALWTYA